MQVKYSIGLHLQSTVAREAVGNYLDSANNLSTVVFHPDAVRLIVADDAVCKHRGTEINIKPTAAVCGGIAGDYTVFYLGTGVYAADSPAIIG